MGEFVKKSWGIWSKWFANPFTLFGGAVFIFLGLSSFNAHAADPDGAHLGDDLYGFWEPAVEAGPAPIIEGLGLFAVDMFNAAAIGLTDFVFPGASLAFNAIAEVISSDVVTDVAMSAVDTASEFIPS